MTKKITLVFDMDGTIADLYGVHGWLKMLNNEDSTPYRKAKPLGDIQTINQHLENLKKKGVHVVVTSWNSKQGSRAYSKKVRSAKVYWLKKQGFPVDEIHIVKYGTPKQEVTKHLGGYQILFDDNKKVRAAWDNGMAVNQPEIIETLQTLEHLLSQQNA